MWGQRFLRVSSKIKRAGSLNEGRAELCSFFSSVTPVKALQNPECRTPTPAHIAGQRKMQPVPRASRENPKHRVGEKKNRLFSIDSSASTMQFCFAIKKKNLKNLYFFMTDPPQRVHRCSFRINRLKARRFGRCAVRAGTCPCHKPAPPRQKAEFLTPRPLPDHTLPGTCPLGSRTAHGTSRLRTHTSADSDFNTKPGDSTRSVHLQKQHNYLLELSVDG